MDDGGESHMTEAVIFDMDGLMFDSERLVQLSWTLSGRALGYEEEDLGQNIYQTLGMGVASRRAYFLEHYGEAFPFDTFRQYTKRFFWEKAEEEGIGVKPGLYELLTYLKENGYKIGMATSSSYDYAAGNLERAGIRGYFDAIVCGNMIERTKPAPDIYLKAAGLLMEAPSCCLALEDAPNGVLSAVRAGMPVVMIPDLLEPKPEIERLLYAKCGNLSEIIPLLEKKRCREETHSITY